VVEMFARLLNVKILQYSISHLEHPHPKPVFQVSSVERMQYINDANSYYWHLSVEHLRKIEEETICGKRE